MTANAHLISACCAMVILTFVVALKLLYVRVCELRDRRLHPQAVSTSAQMTQLQNIQASDNYRNLFEAPVLFYTLACVSLSVDFTPNWMVFGCWSFVLIRCIHSFIHCTYNNVLQRFIAFSTSYVILVSLWGAFTISWVMYDLPK